jgi:hypothetical protein
MGKRQYQERLHKMMGSIPVEPPAPLSPGDNTHPVGTAAAGYVFTYNNNHAGFERPPSTQVELPLMLHGQPVGALSVEADSTDSRELSRQVAGWLEERLAEILQPAARPKLEIYHGPARIKQSGDPAALVQPIHIRGSEIGAIEVRALTPQPELLETVAAILGDRLEVLVLQERLAQAEAEAEKLRRLLQH